MTAPNSEPRRGMPLLARGICFFLLFALLLGGLHWICLHHYKNAAAWGGEGGALRDSLLYDGTVYYLAAEVGAPGISASVYAQGDLLGEIKPEGLSALRYSLPVYTVKASAGKQRDGYLLVVYEDGESYIYYRQGTDNPYRPAESDTSDTEDDEEPIG